MKNSSHRLSFRETGRLAGDLGEYRELDVLAMELERGLAAVEILSVYLDSLQHFFHEPNAKSC